MARSAHHDVIVVAVVGAAAGLTMMMTVMMVVRMMMVTTRTTERSVDEEKKKRNERSGHNEEEEEEKKTEDGSVKKIFDDDDDDDGGGLREEVKERRRHLYSNVLDSIGDTPLIELASLRNVSNSGCRIYCKLEMNNPGGSIKDRVALRIIEEAMERGEISRNSGTTVTEGTAGSTGVSLSLVCSLLGLRCSITMPDDAATEKSEAIVRNGANVKRVRPVAFSHPDHMVHIARREAKEINDDNDDDEDENENKQRRGKTVRKAFFANQFDNKANMRAHYYGTGREIWTQTSGKVDVFVCGAGTGGTIAGVGAFLKEQKKKEREKMRADGKVNDDDVMIVLSDPQGSSLFNYITRGVMYTTHEAEGQRLRNPIDTITEGVGINRWTANMGAAVKHIDAAIKCSDAEAVEMASYIHKKEGLFIGSSSAINIVGAVRVAQYLASKKSTSCDSDQSNRNRETTIVTIICDSGERHMSKFHNASYLKLHNMTPTAEGLEFLHCSNTRSVLTLAKRKRRRKSNRKQNTE